jgi:hypothetical protein
MNFMQKLRLRVTGLTDTSARYPLAIACFIATYILNTIQIISKTDDYTKLIITFLVGAALGAVSQAVYERFPKGRYGRYLLMLLAIVLGVGYYLVINSFSEFRLDISIRTTVLFFILAVLFLWVPVIKNKYHFNQSFLAAFKALFISLFYFGVLALGVSIIIAAIDNLITPVNEYAYIHSLNFIFTLLAPVYFLSLIPSFKENEESEDRINKAISCPRVLEILISYIIIPITAGFTIILLLYIILNIGGSFWTDNLMEPMLVSYSIIVIIVYLLASNIENKANRLFRMVFPKVLVPIVLFQTISSFLSTKEVGITYGRYYAILFGIFAVIAGLIFCFVPVRKNGMVAGVLVLLSVISIVPPVDAFTVSRISQTNMLKNILLANNMLNENKIIPNEEISDEDKKSIVRTVEYLQQVDDIGKIAWLSEYKENYNFKQTFGFDQYFTYDDKNEYLYLNLEPSIPIDITGYDTMVDTSIAMITKTTSAAQNYVTIKGLKYMISHITEGKSGAITITDEKDQEIVRLSMDEMIQRFKNYDTQRYNLTLEEATFTKENEVAKMTLIFKTINMNKQEENQYEDTSFYLLLKIK